MKKILMAEDEENISDFVSRGLRNFNYEVTVAADGDEAWRLLEKENNFDLEYLSLAKVIIKIAILSQLDKNAVIFNGFISQINTSTDIQKDWLAYIQKKKVEELEQITAELKLKPEETKIFIENSFRDGALRTTGTDIDKILPPTSRFGGGNRSEVKKNVITRLLEFFERYFGV